MSGGKPRSPGKALLTKKGFFTMRAPCVLTIIAARGVAAFCSLNQLLIEPFAREAGISGQSTRTQAQSASRSYASRQNSSAAGMRRLFRGQVLLTYLGYASLRNKTNFNSLYTSQHDAHRIVI
jgi:hypothetical protein